MLEILIAEVIRVVATVVMTVLLACTMYDLLFRQEAPKSLDIIIAVMAFFAILLMHIN